MDLQNASSEQLRKPSCVDARWVNYAEKRHSARLATLATCEGRPAPGPVRLLARLGGHPAVVGLAVRVFATGSGRLNGFKSRARSLRLVDGVLPVGVGVLEENLVAQPFAGDAALRLDVAQRRRRLEKPQLGLEIFLAVFLRLARPEDVARVAGHLTWQVV
jgi:hypothetical protein